MSLVVFSDVSLHLGGRPIVEGLSLRIGDKDRVGLVGPNGSGKTTLLRLIAREQVPDGGAVHRAKTMRLGYLPQDVNVEGGKPLLAFVLESIPGRASLDEDLATAEADLEALSAAGDHSEEAQEMIDRYFERFPGIQRYIHETLESVRERGYSETLFGRKTWFPRINSKNQAERQGSERAAINAPLQGTSADIIKRAMVRIMPALEEQGLGHVRMLLQVHDELVFELPESDAEAAAPVIEQVMSQAALPAVKLDVPLGVAAGSGPSWGSAH